MPSLPASAPPGLQSPKTITAIKYMSKINVWLFKRTGGRLGGKWRVGAAFPWGVPVLLLTHTGRKTGEKRVSPLLYLHDGDNVIVVASQGGLPKNPVWFLNLKADPDVTVQIKSDVMPMLARVADPDERKRLWPKLVELYSDFDNYQKWTDREIPVVILSPVTPTK